MLSKDALQTEYPFPEMLFKKIKSDTVNSCFCGLPGSGKSSFTNCVVCVCHGALLDHSLRSVAPSSSSSSSLLSSASSSSRSLPVPFSTTSCRESCKIHVPEEFSAPSSSSKRADLIVIDPGKFTAQSQQEIIAHGLGLLKNSEVFPHDDPGRQQKLSSRKFELKKLASCFVLFISAEHLLQNQLNKDFVASTLLIIETAKNFTLPNFEDEAFEMPLICIITKCDLVPGVTKKDLLVQSNSEALKPIFTKMTETFGMTNSDIVALGWLHGMDYDTDLSFVSEDPVVVTLRHAILKMAGAGEYFISRKLKEVVENSKEQNHDHDHHHSTTPSPPTGSISPSPYEECNNNNNATSTNVSSVAPTQQSNNNNNNQRSHYHSDPTSSNLHRSPSSSQIPNANPSNNTNHHDQHSSHATPSEVSNVTTSHGSNATSFTKNLSSLEKYDHMIKQFDSPAEFFQTLDATQLLEYLKLKNVHQDVLDQIKSKRFTGKDFAKSDFISRLDNMASDSLRMKRFVALRNDEWKLDLLSDLNREFAGKYCRFVFAPSEVEIDYSIGGRIGFGAYGAVFKAKIKSLNNRRIAAKVFYSPADGIKEARIHLDLCHHNIVTLYGLTVCSATVPPSVVLLMERAATDLAASLFPNPIVSEEDAKQQAPARGKILELANYHQELIADRRAQGEKVDEDAASNSNTLYEKQDKMDEELDNRTDRPLNPHQVVKFAEQLASCLSYLHNKKSEDGTSKRILHLDLKPSNILVFPGDTLKLVDFGSVEKVANTNVKVSVIHCTDSYSPPEYFIALSGKSKHLHVSPAFDVFSFGVVLLQMLTAETKPKHPNFCVYRSAQEMLVLTDNMVPLNPGSFFSLENRTNEKVLSCLEIDSSIFETAEEFKFMATESPSSSSSSRVLSRTSSHVSTELMRRAASTGTASFSQATTTRERIDIERNDDHYEIDEELFAHDEERHSLNKLYSRDNFLTLLLLQLCQKCLAVDPRNRPKDGSALVEELELISARVNHYEDLLVVKLYSLARKASSSTNDNESEQPMYYPSMLDKLKLISKANSESSKLREKILEQHQQQQRFFTQHHHRENSYNPSEVDDNDDDQRVPPPQRIPPIHYDINSNDDETPRSQVSNGNDEFSTPSTARKNKVSNEEEQSQTHVETVPNQNNNNNNNNNHHDAEEAVTRRNGNDDDDHVKADSNTTSSDYENDDVEPVGGMNDEFN